ncbi:YesL family protein [Gracilibacillus phocaeensis]|uniref:YesL family protein n=1 Tax=Gracilibacillus phocaeensis TaxID=2042304 RepID=UPI0010318309|nr:DUF624 domain-containing protein [Gracilibacillus phocaeensis]
MNSQHSNGFQYFFEWAAKLAYLNILWILYSLAGLFVLGIGPATASLFTIMRDKLKGNDDYIIWRRFHDVYRQSFWRLNQLMIPIYVVGAFIYLDFLFVQALPSSFVIDYVVFPALLLLTTLFILGSSYVFALYVYVEYPYGRHIKNAFLMVGLYPLSSIFIFAGLSVFSVILFIFPAIFPFYGISIPALIVISCANRAFDAFTAAKNLQLEKEAIDKPNNPV